MPRPRKNDPTTLIRPILTDFARALSETIERATLERVRAAVEAALEQGAAPRPRGTRAPTRCYVPGCKNVAAPRFGMFCVAQHKDLPASEKARFRKLAREQKAGGAAAAAPLKATRRRRSAR